MSLEQIPNQAPKQEIKVQPKIEVEPNFDGFVPDEFKNDPLKYFEEKGTNIKPGETKYDETGRVREDPTAVKDLPVWKNKEGVELHTVGKRVNKEKGKIGEIRDPFYEYKVMEIIQELGLPCPRPVARVEQGGNNLIVMERVHGIRWPDKDSLHLNEKGYSAEDIQGLISQAEVMVRELHRKFEDAGISRDWKLKDMLFDIDIENKKINSIVPTDWERTTINQEKLAQARALKRQTKLDTEGP
ncbi:MAG: hypothetical protein QY311_03105 [Candidatus Paceibacterota bacterium]|nr:MAG: hypothetical protein QY311_03105 [Candidatus Paceibacterota bacterium]